MSSAEGYGRHDYLAGELPRYRFDGAHYLGRGPTGLLERLVPGSPKERLARAYVAGYEAERAEAVAFLARRA